MARVNKYLYPYNIQQQTEQGWETVNAEDNPRDARRSKREYQENQPEYPVRVVRGREPNPAFQE